MRYVVAVVQIAGLIVAGNGLVRADDRDRALSVVDDAIRAHGGESALAKTRNMHRTGKGSWFLFEKENPFSFETTMQLPDRLRDTAEADIAGQKNRVTTIVHGDRAWQSLGAAFSEVEKGRTSELREEYYVLWLTTLLPVKEKGMSLTLLPQVYVLGKEAMVVKVTANNRPDVTLYFDKQSRLLIKMERQAKQAGVTVKKEYFLTDHKDFAGTKLPSRWLEVTNGNKSVDLTITQCDFPSRVDDKLFERP